MCVLYVCAVCVLFVLCALYVCVNCVCDVYVVCLYCVWYVFTVYGICVLCVNDVWCVYCVCFVCSVCCMCVMCVLYVCRVCAMCAVLCYIWCKKDLEVDLSCHNPALRKLAHSRVGKWGLELLGKRTEIKEKEETKHSAESEGHSMTTECEGGDNRLH